MPYIPQERRKKLNPLIESLEKEISHEGELVYCVFYMLMGMLDREQTNFSSLSHLIGLVECIKQEFYRQVVGPYEDGKKEENGPVDG